MLIIGNNAILYNKDLGVQIINSLKLEIWIKYLISRAGMTLIVWYFLDLNNICFVNVWVILRQLH